mgnify:FL=1
MEKPLNEIYQFLQKLIGHYRQLMDFVRAEREALVQADIKGIHEALAGKEALLQLIQQTEKERMQVVAELALLWKKPLRDLTLTAIIHHVQGTDLKRAEQLRSVHTTLNMMIQRVRENNEDNRAFVEKSLVHIGEMKRNVLGEAVPRADTYNPQGQRSANTGSSRLVNREA